MAIVCYVIDGRKQCSSCKETKPVADFSKSQVHPSGYRSACRRCNADRVAKWRTDDRKNYRASVDRTNKRRREDPKCRARHREEVKRDYREMPIEQRRKKHWKNHLMTSYRLTVERHEAMVKAHAGRCACCNKKTEFLDIDHDHKTGKVRGLLCRSCNTGIGRLGDSIEGLQRAIAYLQSPVKE